MTILGSEYLPVNGYAMTFRMETTSIQWEMNVHTFLEIAPLS